MNELQESKGKTSEGIIESEEKPMEKNDQMDIISVSTTASDGTTDYDENLESYYLQKGKLSDQCHVQLSNGTQIERPIEKPNAAPNQGEIIVISDSDSSLSTPVLDAPNSDKNGTSKVNHMTTESTVGFDTFLHENSSSSQVLSYLFRECDFQKRSKWCIDIENDLLEEDDEVFSLDPLYDLKAIEEESDDQGQGKGSIHQEAFECPFSLSQIDTTSLSSSTLSSNAMLAENNAMIMEGMKELQSSSSPGPFTDQQRSSISALCSNFILFFDSVAHTNEATNLMLQLKTGDRVYQNCSYSVIPLEESPAASLLSPPNLPPETVLEIQTEFHKYSRVYRYNKEILSIRRKREAIKKKRQETYEYMCKNPYSSTHCYVCGFPHEPSSLLNQSWSSYSSYMIHRTSIGIPPDLVIYNSNIYGLFCFSTSSYIPVFRHKKQDRSYLVPYFNDLYLLYQSVLKRDNVNVMYGSDTRFLQVIIGKKKELLIKSEATLSTRKASVSRLSLRKNMNVKLHFQQKKRMTKQNKCDTMVQSEKKMKQKLVKSEESLNSPTLVESVVEDKVEKESESKKEEEFVEEKKVEGDERLELEVPVEDKHAENEPIEDTLSPLLPISSVKRVDEEEIQSKSPQLIEDSTREKEIQSMMNDLFNSIEQQNPDSGPTKNTTCESIESNPKSQPFSPVNQGFFHTYFSSKPSETNMKNRFLSAHSETSSNYYDLFQQYLHQHKAALCDKRVYSCIYDTDIF